MPFTIAHPAIILPLRKRGSILSTTGLIIGSMIPDLEYFIQMREVENLGHQWYGIFLFDMPMAILLAFLFHNLLRDPLLLNLPNAYKKRFIHNIEFDWNTNIKNNKGPFLISTFIGVISHLMWDSFTHHDGFIVESISALSKNIIILEYSVPIYFLLQIVFSLLGLAFVHLQIMRMPISNKKFKSKIDYGYWMVFILLFFTIISVRIILWPEYNTFGGIAIAIMGSIFYSWISVSIIFIKLK
jgi:hypothetical protein